LLPITIAQQRQLSDIFSIETGLPMMSHLSCSIAL
jgi:hypothetical protein